MADKTIGQQREPSSGEFRGPWVASRSITVNRSAAQSKGLAKVQHPRVHQAPAGHGVLNVRSNIMAAFIVAQETMTAVVCGMIIANDACKARWR